MFENVYPRVAPWKAPISTEPAGRNMKRSVYAKNGSVTIHASGRRLRPDKTSGRSASGATWVAMTYEPIFAGHCSAIRFFAAVCWPRLANFAFA